MADKNLLEKLGIRIPHGWFYPEVQEISNKHFLKEYIRYNYKKSLKNFGLTILGSTLLLDGLTRMYTTIHADSELN